MAVLSERRREKNLFRVSIKSHNTLTGDLIETYIAKLVSSDLMLKSNTYAQIGPKFDVTQWKMKIADPACCSI